MFEKLTEQARHVVVVAQELARDLHHRDIGTGVMLLALTRQETGDSARALASAGVTEEAVGQQITELIRPGPPLPPNLQIPFSAPAKQALELSAREADALGQARAGTGHLLLAVMDVGSGQATRILNGLGVDPRAVRQQVIEVLSAGQGAAEER